MQRRTFQKAERLANRTLIQQLFDQGESITEGPVRLLWLETPNHSRYPAQVLITVPRRKFKRASDRNLLKRRLREAYRKHKDMLYDHLRKYGKQGVIGIVYNSSEALEYPIIEDKIMLLLQRLTGADGQVIK